MTATASDTKHYREFFGQLPTGVTVIAARTDQGVRGLVVGTFASASLDPPLVTFMVTTGSRSWAAVRTAGRFTANILASDQRRLSQRLAGWSPEKFSDVELDTGRDDAVAIAGCVAWADCSVDRELAAGDHTIVLACPMELTLVRPSARPLVFYQGAYHRRAMLETCG